MPSCFQNPTLVQVTFVAILSTLPSCSENREPIDARPNVLLITIETLRADHVSSYGYKRRTTPNLDLLASQGAQFETVIAQAPFTLPSITSLLTSLTPPRHGVRNHPGTLSSEHQTLAEKFLEAGYETVALTRHTWLRRKSGLDQGFVAYRNNKLSTGLDARSLSLAAVDFLESRDSSKPFFLWLHFLDPHLPYTPSYPYSTLYQNGLSEEPQVSHLRSMLGQPRETFEPTPYADIPGGPYYDLVLPQYPKNPILLDLAFWRRSRGSIFFNNNRYKESHLAELRDLYDGAITYTDDNVGRILKAVSALELDESTIIALTSDHGEALGEHQLFFTHDFTLYDEVLKVPLILRYPGFIHPDTVITQQVRLVDVAPTLLELSNLTPFSRSEGISLAPLFQGRSLPFLNAFAESAPRRHMFPEQKRIYFDGNRGKWRMLRTDRWKLIRIPHPEGDRHELYDMVNDPHEKTNLFNELPGEGLKLAPLLNTWMANDPERDVDRSSQENADIKELDPAAIQQLRTLGYIP